MSEWASGTSSSKNLTWYILVSLAVPWGINMETCLGFDPLGSSGFLQQHPLEDLKRQTFPLVCSWIFEEIFGSSLTGRRDKGRTTSVTRNTHFAKAVWKSHKMMDPAFNKRKSTVPEEEKPLILRVTTLWPQNIQFLTKNYIWPIHRRKKLGVNYVCKSSDIWITSQRH